MWRIEAKVNLSHNMDLVEFSFQSKGLYFLTETFDCFFALDKEFYK